MRALVLGGAGAVGAEIVRSLTAEGHAVTATARRARESVMELDLTSDRGWAKLAEAAAGHDVVVNASGLEDVRLAGTVGGAALVDISATGEYLHALAEAAPSDARLVLGAGLAPGLTTSLVTALAPARGSVIDVAVMLGGGERHGAAAVEWTAGLVGRPVFGADDGARNLVGWTDLPAPDGHRGYLRADFPDDVLVGRRLGVSVHSHLAVDDRLSTWALALVGRAPWLRGAVARAPHLGTDRWFVAARDRTTGETLSASGRRQSLATGVVAALAAERVAARSDAGLLVVPDLMEVSEIRSAVAAAEQHRSASGIGA